MSFVLPGQEEVRWELVLDTRLEDGFLEDPKILAFSDEYQIGDRSFSLLRLRLGGQPQARGVTEKARTKNLANPALKRKKCENKGSPIGFRSSSQVQILN
jgi:hypothetical protein